MNDAPHPAQLIDALSGYCYLIDVLGIPSSRIVIIGACSGGTYHIIIFGTSPHIHSFDFPVRITIGHLALMLTRYLHDEQVLPLPLGVMLFSVRAIYFFFNIISLESIKFKTCSLGLIWVRLRFLVLNLIIAFYLNCAYYFSQLLTKTLLRITPSQGPTLILIFWLRLTLPI